MSGGQIWRPRAVFPSTIRYSTVALSNLPLNADLLGLDRAFGQGGRAGQQVGIERQFALPVPALQAIEGLSHLWALAAVEVQVGIQPPIAQGGPLFVPQLDGAASELVVNSWHSVQETPQAIVEIRRILQAHLEGRVARADAQ